MTLTEDDLDILDEGPANNRPNENNLPQQIQNNVPIVATKDFKTHHHPINPRDITSDEVGGRANKAILLQELENYDIYLHNIHKGFESATSINALSRLVRDGLSVNKQRRAAIEHAMNLRAGSDSPIFDVMGNRIKG